MKSSTGYFRVFFSVGPDGDFIEVLETEVFVTHLVSDKARGAEEYIREEVSGYDDELAEAVGRAEGVHELLAEVTVRSSPPAHYDYGDYDAWLEWDSVQHRKLTPEEEKAFTEPSTWEAGAEPVQG